MFVFNAEWCKRLRRSEGSAAVEFALLTPAVLLLLVGIVVISFVLCVYSALQQIAAEAARAGLSGITAAQQSQLAANYVSGVIGNYSFLDPGALKVTSNSTANTFQVALTYNASGMFFSTFANPSVSTPVTITRTATVQTGGF